MKTTTYNHHRGIIDGRTLQQEPTVARDAQFDFHDRRSHLDLVESVFEATDDPDEAAALITDLGLDDLILCDPDIKVFRMTTPEGLGDLNREELRFTHREARHDDGKPSVEVPAEHTVVTAVALITGELSVRLHNSKWSLSKVIADLHMRPGDVVTFDPSKKHSFVPVGNEPRLSYSIPHFVKIIS